LTIVIYDRLDIVAPGLIRFEDRLQIRYCCAQLYSLPRHKKKIEAFLL
jgi:hypothetical protein